jgi:hypothetical protein
MLPEQQGSLNLSLNKLVQKGRKVSDEQILGAYEMVVQHAMPTRS